MKEIKFSELKFPEGLNLSLLSSVLSERKFREFIVAFSSKKRKERRIILPSQKTIKKVFFHYLWSKVENGEITWSEIKNSFRKDFETLKKAGISKKEVIKKYEQRRLEILSEKIKKVKVDNEK